MRHLKIIVSREEVSLRIVRSVGGSYTGKARKWSRHIRRSYTIRDMSHGCATVSC